jgi:hypothetical protein
MSDRTWTLETVIKCDHCSKPMIPNQSTWDEDGCAWICTTFGCPYFAGEEIEPEDLEAVGVPEWVAERIAALADAFLESEDWEAVGVPKGVAERIAAWVDACQEVKG